MASYPVSWLRKEKATEVRSQKRGNKKILFPLCHSRAGGNPGRSQEPEEDTVMK
ncbi:MAG: hypothetical protein U9N03_07125 [Candidatus Caldatribacteriota bacterium]|nr:hypothetical protein [Candidatus Caldatribacteriota bacterium]